MAVIYTSEEGFERNFKIYNNLASIAAINGPSNIVISGDKQAIERIQEKLGKDGIPSQILNVSHAFHSPLMGPMLYSYEKLCEKIIYSQPQIPFFSTLYGDIVGENWKPDAHYWRFQTERTVLFARGCSVEFRKVMILSLR